MAPSSETDGRLAAAALDELDPVLQHRARLGAAVLLAGVQSLSFSRLKSLLNETDGNLGAQLRKLEESGYIGVEKRFENRKPISWYSLLPAGRAALTRHLGAMQQLMASSSSAIATD